MVAGNDGPTYYVKNDAYDGDDYQVKLEQLRPRARKVLSRSDQELGMIAGVVSGWRGWWTR